MLTQAALLAALLVPALPLPGSAAPFPQSPSQRVEVFQTCAGRLSALIEHQWLLQPGAADRTEALRDEFDLLIEAVMPDALSWGMPPEMAMHWRISAKANQARLLSAASFSTDPLRAERARRIAAERMAECDGLLIG